MITDYLNEETYLAVRDSASNLVVSLTDKIPEDCDPLVFTAAVVGMMLGTGVAPAVRQDGPDAADKWMRVVQEVANFSLKKHDMHLDMKFVRKEE